MTWGRQKIDRIQILERDRKFEHVGSGVRCDAQVMENLHLLSTVVGSRRLVGLTQGHWEGGAHRNRAKVCKG